MKLTIIVFVGCISITGLLFAKGYDVPETKSGNFIETKSDPKVLLVESFWNAALKGDDVGEFIKISPSNIFDEISRCERPIETDNKEKSKIAIMDAGENRLNLIFLKKRADRIKEEHFTILSVKTFRNWKKEAIVEVNFAKAGYQYGFNYFYLISTNGKWKIIESTYHPDAINEEFAKYECPKNDS